MENEVFIMKFKSLWKKAVLTATATMMIGSAAFAATPAETYAEAAQNTITQTAGEYTLHVDMSMPFIGSMNVNGVIDAQALPTIQGKGTLHMTMAGKTMEPSTVYIEQNGKTVTSYYSTTKDGQTTWKKRSQELKSETAAKDYLNEQHNVMDGVKSVSALGNDQYQVVFDSSRIYSKDTIDTIKIKYGANEKAVDLTEKVLKALQQSDDIRTTVTIDPTTKKITNIALPMTPQLRQIALTVLDNANTSEANQAVIRQFINNSDISISIGIKDLPEGVDFTIPQDVKNQAVAINQ